MKKNILPFIVFLSFVSIVLAIGLLVSNKLKKQRIDPTRIKINVNGEEVIVLNELEKRHVGKWYLAFEGDTPLDMKPNKSEYNRNWEFVDDGWAINHRPDGKKVSFYWHISESDSILSLIVPNLKEADSIRYEIYELGDDNFSAYMQPNKLRMEGGHYVRWQKYDMEN